MEEGVGTLEDLVVVTGAGDVKPLHDWYQLHDGAENLSLDLNLLENWRTSNKPCATR